MDAAQPPTTLFQRVIKRLLGGFELQDILFAHRYSVDFAYTRADYIDRRLRFMLLFFVCAVPAWIPVDYLTLSPAHFQPIALARLGLTAFLLSLYLLARRKPTPRLTSLLLSLTLVASTVFYLFAMVTFQLGEPEPPLAGYSSMPVMMIALCALFPLTLLNGLALAVMITVAYLGLQLWQGTLIVHETLNTLWVLGLMISVSLWIQCGQLLMLLKLYRESTRDALTGLINRRVLMKQFELLLDEEEQPTANFCVLMCDLDRFKRINDNYGHLMGDQVLKLAAKTLQNALRRQEIVARFGGEEFMVILPDTSLEQASALAEGVRHAFEISQCFTESGEQIPVTTSIGLTQYQAGERIEVLLERVDQWLYQAKNRGRNQVVTDQTAGSTGAAA